MTGEPSEGLDVVRPRVVIYLRGSDDDSDTSHQRFICNEYARTHGWNVVETYDEGGGQSGGKLHRPMFDAMLHRLAEKRDVSTLLLYKYDRALRNTKELLELKSFTDSLGIALVSATQPIQTGTPEGNAYFTMGGAFAQLELDFASARIRDAYKHVLAEGGTRPSASWRAKAKPDVSARWGRPPGAKDKKPRKRRWFRKPAEAASPIETIRVADLQAEIRSLDTLVKDKEQAWLTMEAGEARGELLRQIENARRDRAARVAVIESFVLRRASSGGQKAGEGGP